jgi:hypothetical protein
VLQAQLAVLRSDPALVNQQARIMGIASRLEELANVPMVAGEMAIILEVQTDEFWQDINLPILENARRRLRQLVKLIEPKDRTIAYTDFEDEIGAAVDVTLPNIGAGTGALPDEGPPLPDSTRKPHYDSEASAQRAVNAPGPLRAGTDVRRGIRVKP